MSQAHSKFKVFVAQGPLTPEVLQGFTGELNTLKDVEPKSVGVEYLEGSKKTILSIGYSDGPGYHVQLKQVDMGKVEVAPYTVEQALEKAASQFENVICHEFYVTDDGNFYAVLMLQG